MGENNVPQIIVAQFGARHHYAVPMAFYRAGMLARFYTDTYAGAGSALHPVTKVLSLLPRAWKPATLQRMLCRREDSLPADMVTSFNFLGFRYFFDLARAKDTASRIDVDKKYGDLFSLLVLQHCDIRANCIYTFHGAALPLLQAAKARGWLGLYDQFSAPTAIMYEIYREEYARWSGWERWDIDSNLILGMADREQACWDIADYIFCASEFVQKGLMAQGVSSSKIKLVPYGVDFTMYDADRPLWDGSRPLRLLFVGAITVRKGVQYLYEAVKQLQQHRVEVRLVGKVMVSPTAKQQLATFAELIGHLPRNAMVDQYQWADLLVFPTVCDGFGLVQIEALAAGLPVITTPNAGSVVRDGVEGYIVPIRNAEALADRIDVFARDPDLLAKMSRNAQARARDFSVHKYCERLASTVKKLPNMRDI